MVDKQLNTANTAKHWNEPLNDADQRTRKAVSCHWKMTRAQWRKFSNVWRILQTSTGILLLVGAHVKNDLGATVTVENKLKGPYVRLFDAEVHRTSKLSSFCKWRNSMTQCGNHVPSLPVSFLPLPYSEDVVLSCFCSGGGPLSLSKTKYTWITHWPASKPHQRTRGLCTTLCINMSFVLSSQSGRAGRRPTTTKWEVNQGTMPPKRIPWQIRWTLNFDVWNYHSSSAFFNSSIRHSCNKQWKPIFIYSGVFASALVFLGMEWLISYPIKFSSHLIPHAANYIVLIPLDMSHNV